MFHVKINPLDAFLEIGCVKVKIEKFEVSQFVYSLHLY